MKYLGITQFNYYYNSKSKYMLKVRNTAIKYY